MKRRPTTCQQIAAECQTVLPVEGVQRSRIRREEAWTEKKCNFHALPFQDYRKRRNNRVIGFFLSKWFIEYADITIMIDREVNPNAEYLILVLAIMLTEDYIFPIHFASFLPEFPVQACIRDNAKNIELTSNRRLTRCHFHADVRKRIQLMKCRSNGR